jgi:phage shock protein A
VNRPATAFDTLAYAKKLQEGGFTVQQAEAQTEALRLALEQDLATKQDVESLRLELKQDIALLRHELREMEARLEVKMAHLETRMAQLEARMAEMQSRWEARSAQMETRLLVRLGTIVIGAITLLGVFLGALIALVQ